MSYTPFLLPQVQFEDTFGTFHKLKSGTKVKLTGVLERGGTLLPVCFVGEWRLLSLSRVLVHTYRWNLCCQHLRGVQRRTAEAGFWFLV